ncbi:MAG: cyclopropane fatty acyl phospholipid synthase [Parcubacteria group bacterium]|nr:cyclopropane fatty acyl phospholipid synthase [Parcubacteria group bacterium]
MNSKKRAQSLLDKADITINGDKPYDIKVLDERFYDRVFSGGTLALGESYMDGWWEVEDLSTFFSKIFAVRVESKITKIGVFFYRLKAKLLNLQSVKRAFEVAEVHYDAGNDLYKVMLDKRMVYTCGYWKEASNLDDAQEAKLDLICRKLNFKEGQRVLDIGCGWGSFAKFAAERYGVEVVGITVSKEQLKLARENTKGLSVEIRLQDYRDLDEKFDHIVSIGMFEHVGYKNHREFMEVVSKSLKDGGLLLLHTIGANISAVATDPWIHKYIFPNGLIPSATQVSEAIEGYFVMEDWHNFGADYDKTLMAWFENFDSGWESIKGNYDERFYRMWKYYLLLSAATFRARRNNLWQIVLSKKGVVGGYTSIR